jgi:hypothetical protein
MGVVTDGNMTYSPMSSPYGHTFGEWTVKWWEWFFSVPKQINPAFDESGKYASVNQPASYVWFPAGKVGEENKTFPKRYCKIPSSRSILFPVINCEVNKAEHPELGSENDLLERVDADENTITHKVCLLDSKVVPVVRIKSDPAIFQVRINSENAFDIKSSEVDCAADGYWVFLKPLSIGEHTISFRGSCEYGKLNSGADYYLQIEHVDET